MLNGIHLVDFGNHRDTRLTFGRMTALVGQNGAGKTNVMRAIQEVECMGFLNKVQIDTVGHKVRSGASKWSISASWTGALKLREGIEQDGKWAVVINSQNKKLWLWCAESEDFEGWVPDPKDDWEAAPAWDKRNLRTRTYNAMSGPVSAGVTVRPVNLQVGVSWRSPYFKTAGSYLQKPSYSEESIPLLSEDCHDLAWMISYLKGDKDDTFSAIIEALKKVVPTFRRIRHRPVSMNRLEQKEMIINKQAKSYDEERTVMGQELRFDMASGSDLPASAISEGTLITLAVLTAIMHDHDNWKNLGNKTILLDDIESGLHPSAQRDLVRQMRLLQETRPELQIIFSSHSPYIIDEMSSEDVWLFAPDKEGIAHCAKLSDHPDAKRALGVLTTGEFWSAEGESWVLDPSKRASEEAMAAAK